MGDSKRQDHNGRNVKGLLTDVNYQLFESCVVRCRENHETPRLATPVMHKSNWSRPESEARSRNWQLLKISNRVFAPVRTEGTPIGRNPPDHA